MVFLSAYALAFYTAFHNASPYFKSFAVSIRTLTLSLLSGDTSEWDHEIYIANRYFGPLGELCVVLCCCFLKMICSFVVVVVLDL